jgi:hypothetical protein
MIHTILGKPESAFCAVPLSDPVSWQSSYGEAMFPDILEKSRKALIEVFLSEIHVHFPHCRKLDSNGDSGEADQHSALMPISVPG